jgi:Gly-Xaa carboxypeptidase
MLSALLVHYENNPTPFVLERANPVYEMLQCFAAHGQTMDTRQRSLVLSSTSSDRALQKLSQSVEAGDFGLDVRALTTTTQAIDIISGGVKANALPEGAVALINHRIAVTSCVPIPYASAMTNLL